MARPPSNVRPLDLSDDEEISNAESYHSRRSHSTNTGGAHSRHNSSNCINLYSSHTDPLQSTTDPHDDRGIVGMDVAGGSAGGTESAHGSHGSHVNVRRSASGVFRYPNEDSENQFSDQLYLLENGCHRHPNIMSDYAAEDMYQSPKDPFDG